MSCEKKLDGCRLKKPKVANEITGLNASVVICSPTTWCGPQFRKTESMSNMGICYLGGSKEAKAQRIGKRGQHPVDTFLINKYVQ